MGCQTIRVSRVQPAVCGEIRTRVASIVFVCDIATIGAGGCSLRTPAVPLPGSWEGQAMADGLEDIDG
jgi:hypothetical protein